MINSSIVGYHRTVPKGDFRVSGHGKVVYSEFPKEAVKLALLVTEKLGMTNLSVDMLQSKTDGKYYVIEVSQFIKVEGPSELRLGRPGGRFRYLPKEDKLVFEPGEYWVQELILRKFFERHFSARRPAKKQERDPAS